MTPILTPYPLAITDQSNDRDIKLSVTETIEILRHWFGVEFSVLDADGNSLHVSREQPQGEEALRSELARAMAHRSEAQLLADEDSVVLLALPFDAHKRRCVAVAAFATRALDPQDDHNGPAALLGIDPAETQEWIQRQTIWQTDILLRLSDAVLGKMAAEAKAKRLEEEVETVSRNLSATYEEISLIYGVTQHSQLSNTDDQLCEMALDWLMECIPAKTIVAQLLPVADEDSVTYEARTKSVMLSKGDSPLGEKQFQLLIDHLGLGPGSGPTVINQNITSTSKWEFHSIQQLIIVPLCEGDNLFGWLAAFNHQDSAEFGTVEASLLSSVGAVLGIHGGNHELYRQQAEFMASVVRALTSAIDAKDPYTCGHSDRVARMSVCLAQHLGYNEETLSTLYMAGLLHDIGKIGIEDRVLRKPGRLTEAEFEHIKMHPELGYKILVDLKQFKDVLPIVLHHHEQWNGRGYPHGLAGEDIPKLARICAVADAYDAMTSDRPYRDGMPVEKVDNIFRDGSGKQWDAEVIATYFAVRDDFLDISRRERANLTVNLQQWT